MTSALYEKARTSDRYRAYLTCAETAKLLRDALKREFPGVKFGVRSSTYSGGASIDVRWTDGPTPDRVDAVLGRFSGAGFDGMIDMKYDRTHFLHPDGTVTLAHDRGTEGSRGSRPECFGDPAGPEAIEVSLGADFVHGQRDFSPEMTGRLIAQIEKAAGIEPGSFSMNGEYDVAIIDGEPKRCTGMHHSERYGNTIFWRLSRITEG